MGEPKLDLEKLKKLHAKAECPTLVAGLPFKITTGATVRNALTEPDGCPVLEYCLPHHAAYAIEAWNQAPLLVAEVERLRSELAALAKSAEDYIATLTKELDDARHLAHDRAVLWDMAIAERDARDHVIVSLRAEVERLESEVDVLNARIGGLT